MFGKAKSKKKRKNKPSLSKRRAAFIAVLMVVGIAIAVWQPLWLLPPVTLYTPYLYSFGMWIFFAGILIHLRRYAVNRFVRAFALIVMLIVPLWFHFIIDTGCLPISCRQRWDEEVLVDDRYQCRRYYHYPVGGCSRTAYTRYDLLYVEGLPFMLLVDSEYIRGYAF